MSVNKHLRYCALQVHDWRVWAESLEEKKLEKVMEKEESCEGNYGDISRKGD